MNEQLPSAEKDVTRTHRLNTCAQCRDWGKYERHEDHTPAAIQPSPDGGRG